MAIKQKERSELEALRAANKNLKKELKHLKKELSRKDKRQHLYQDLEERQAEEQIEEQIKEGESLAEEKCPECGGKIEGVQLGNRLLLTCEECKYRATKKV